MTGLFDDEFQYIINGKERFENIKSLRNYWCKNKLRQRDLDIKFIKYSVTRNEINSCFVATFFHPGLLRMTAVMGEMTIYSTEDGNRISKFVEVYEKVERFNPSYTFEIFYNFAVVPIFKAFGNVLKPLLSTIKFVLRNGLAVSLLIGVIAVCYVNFIHPNYPLLSEGLFRRIKFLTPIWFAVAFVIQQALPFLNAKIDGDLKVEKFEKNGDLKRMAEVMQSADHVTIVSGDFSFIDTNKKLEARLRELAFARKLTLISYKSKSVVEEEMSSKTSSYDILLKLKDESQIRFGFPVKAKITIVEHGGSRKMLFRFTKEIDGKPNLHLGFIKQSENTFALLDVIEEFIQKSQDRSELN